MAEQSRVEQIMEGIAQSRLDEVRSILNKETLTPLVCKALKRAKIEIQTWECIQVKGGISGNQIYNISGRGTAEKDPVSWSLFLKILNQSTDIISLSDTDWKREPLAYQSGLLDDLPGGLRAAECYRLEHVSDTEIWMWLEDVSEPEGTAWSLERYGLAARHLGQLNGAYLMDCSLPSNDWLVRTFERNAVPRDCNLEAFNVSLDYLQGHNFLSSTSVRSATRLWEEKEHFMTHLYDRLPQTFSHLDTDRRNVFSQTQADGSEETVAIDWGLVGIAAIGEELRRLVSLNLFLRFVGIDQANELYAVALEGYLKGLKEAGWRDNPDLVRYGCAAATGLSFLRMCSLFGTIIPDEDKRAWDEQQSGRTFDETMAIWAQITSFSLELVDEARDLGRTLF